MPQKYPTEDTIKAILTNKPIVVDTALMKKLGYDNTRDFFSALHYWGHNTDFGYLPQRADTDIQCYLREFIRSFND